MTPISEADTRRAKARPTAVQWSGWRSQANPIRPSAGLTGRDEPSTRGPLPRQLRISSPQETEQFSIHSIVSRQCRTTPMIGIAPPPRRMHSKPSGMRHESRSSNTWARRSHNPSPNFGNRSAWKTRGYSITILANLPGTSFGSGVRGMNSVNQAVESSKPSSRGLSLIHPPWIRLNWMPPVHIVVTRFKWCSKLSGYSSPVSTVQGPFTAPRPMPDFSMSTRLGRSRS